VSNSGDVDAVYQELRKIAALHLRRGPNSPSLQPTQLVHEAWLRLSEKGWNSRTHFLALASRTMRMLLIDAARARTAESRGSGLAPLPLDPATQLASPSGALSLEQILDVDQALSLLAQQDARKAQVVELRYFGGLELPEIAATLDVSLATVKRDWEFARAWLLARLSA